jgi:hypothetical protein
MLEFAFYTPNREMEILSGDPTFGDFVTILTEGPMQDNTVERLQITRVQTLLSPQYYSQNILCATLKRRDIMGNLYIYISDSYQL